MTNIKPTPAQERCLQLAEFPDYITTLGTELCLLPHLIRYSELIIDEAEQQCLQDLGLNEGMSHPQYTEGFDDGLRHAIKMIQLLVKPE